MNIEKKIKDFVNDLDIYIDEKVHEILAGNIKDNKVEKDVDEPHKIPDGTSCLIKLDATGVIFIAARRGKIKPSPNKVYINDRQREWFFGDLRDNKIHNNGDRIKYAIYRDTDPELYDLYCKFIKALYNKQKGENDE